MWVPLKHYSSSFVFFFFVCVIMASPLESNGSVCHGILEVLNGPRVNLQQMMNLMCFFVRVDDCVK